MAQRVVISVLGVLVRSSLGDVVVHLARSSPPVAITSNPWPLKLCITLPLPGGSWVDEMPTEKATIRAAVSNLRCRAICLFLKLANAITMMYIYIITEWSQVYLSLTV